MNRIPRPVENSVLSQIARGRTSLDVATLRASGGGRQTSRRARRRAAREAGNVS